MIDKLVTDVFDFFADAYAKVQSMNVREMPDLSDRPINHLISAEEMGDPGNLYGVTDEIPEISFESPKRLPFLDIIDGTFRSPVESPFEENNTVYVRHYRLRGKPGGGPTVIMINGWYVEDYTYFDWWCWRFAAWGLSSVLIDIPYHIRRVPKGSYSGQLLLTTEKDWSILSLKHTFLDVQALANWLKANGAESIGTFGVSFGACMAGIYVCHAENADFAIMGMPPMDAVDTLGKSRLGEELKDMESRGIPTMLTDPDIPKIFNMERMTPNVPNDRIFIGMGVYDRLVTAECVRDTARAWGGLPWLKEYPTGHINTFVMNRPFVRDVRKFVKKEIV